ncbi:hypothetical protein ACVWXN_000289 [Bradyrhizobium sp. i1.4.4]|uniref:Uncharacterized protein n=1 Tax=Bradyrhizobium japonicum TaxID=375 RepID=A0A1Y2JR24_BRAJP|nr:hypothetical protein [Bradyrhizobium japonicum]OSJ33880.1 hypothetical protein BSZ19_13845 [Bradyrhizobium japonicum]
MSENLSQLVEFSVQIAWEYLERSGELGDAAETGHFLSQTIEQMVQQGVRSPLLLSNRAIDAYRRHRGVRLAS